MKRVEVIWKDALLINDWMPEDNLYLYGHPNCNHLGYLVDENDDSVTIVMGYSDSGMYHGRFSIPKGCIKEIKELRTK